MSMFDRPAIAKDFGRAAAGYDGQARLQAQVRARCIMRAEEYWKEGAHILDAGCGTGALAAQQTSGWNITGVDMAQGMCKQAGAHMPAVVAAAEALPFQDNEFDGVFSSLMLQWADMPLAPLREMRRVTKHGGVCVVATFCEGTLAELRDVFAKIDSAPHVSDFIPAPGIVASAVHAGFRVLSAEQETMVEHYPDAQALMRSIKAIGAANKQAGRRKGLMTPRQLSALAQDYSTRFSDKDGVIATWQLFMMILEKI